VYSPDGTKLAFIAQNDGEQFIVINGEKGDNFDEIGSVPIFDYRGNDWAYIVNSGNYSYVVTNKGESKKYDSIAMGSLNFSPFDNQLYFIAKENGKWFVIKDSKISKGYDSIITIGGGNIRFTSKNTIKYLGLNYKMVNPDFPELTTGKIFIVTHKF